jgi:ParB family chromosome partitioning protein
VLVPIASIKVGTRHRKDLGDIDGLAASIADLGLVNPITIAPDGTLLAGGRRLAACKKLGWDKVPVRVMEDKQ